MLVILICIGSRKNLGIDGIIQYSTWNWKTIDGVIMYEMTVLLLLVNYTKEKKEI